MQLGIVIPCRNEARVIARKLANLAAARWPTGRAADAQHILVVVDDGSDDGTAERAREAAERLTWKRGVRVLVRANTRSPGKPGAIATGLAALPAETELVVLTDADVVSAPDALVELARAFEARPGLAMACGAQRFVKSLDERGGFLDGSGAPFAAGTAGGLYDSWTAAVRRFESRSGRLFSVHGQFLAWRRALELAPTPGLAADDLDLRLQVRAREREPRDVALIPTAVFAEVKEPERDDQALRRARAYVQTVVRRRPPVLPSGLDRAQLALYRFGPVGAPWLALAACGLLPLVVGQTLGLRAAVAAVAVVALAFAFAPVRRLARLLGWIVRADFAERRGSMGDRWEMARR